MTELRLVDKEYLGSWIGRQLGQGKAQLELCFLIPSFINYKNISFMCITANKSHASICRPVRQHCIPTHTTALPFG